MHRVGGRPAPHRCDLVVAHPGERHEMRHGELQVGDRDVVLRSAPVAGDPINRNWAIKFTSDAL